MRVDLKGYLNRNEDLLLWQQNYVQRTKRVCECDRFEKFIIETMHSKTSVLRFAVQELGQNPCKTENFEIKMDNIKI